MTSTEGIVELSVSGISNPNLPDSAFRAYVREVGGSVTDVTRAEGSRGGVDTTTYSIHVPRGILAHEIRNRMDGNPEYGVAHMDIQYATPVKVRISCIPR